MTHDYDWVIIGSGFGGSVSALRLAEKGYKVAVIEVKRPQKRDLKLVIDRGTQNAVIDGVFAIKHGLRKAPAALHTTVAGLEVHAGPAEGTA